MCIVIFCFLQETLDLSDVQDREYGRNEFREELGSVGSFLSHT